MEISRVDVTVCIADRNNLLAISRGITTGLDSISVRTHLQSSQGDFAFSFFFFLIR